MRTKVTLALVFLNVALFAFIFYLRSGVPPLDEKPGVLGPEVVNIQSMEITSTARPGPLRLERRGESWHLVEPVDWPANPFAVTRILSELQQLRSQASFAVKDLARNGQSLADYGLEKPVLVLTFRPAGGAAEPTVLRIGDTAKVGNRLYVLSPDGERVHVVNRSLAESLSLRLEELRSDSLFSIQVFEVRSLNLQTGAPTNLKVRIARSNSRWQFESPITTRADKNQTDITVNRLNGLRILTFVDPRAPEALRLSPEEMTLRITLEGNNRREALILGDRLKDPPAGVSRDATASPDGDGPALDIEYYYGKMEDKAPVFTVGVPASLVEDLRNAQETLRDRQILDVDTTAITSIVLAASGQPDLTLQRLEASAASTGAPRWQIVRQASERGPQTVPADQAQVEQLLQHLSGLRAQKFETDAPSEAALEDFGFNRPARRIRITSNPPAGNTPAGAPAPAPATTTLLVGIGVDRNVYAKLDSPNFVYRVDNDTLEQLPVAPLAYRERVLRDLPEGARVTGLKLTDLTEQRVLLEATLPGPEAPPPQGAGETAPPAPAPAPPATAQELAAQLRTLRAQRFVQEEFSKTVSVLGEERPWRYQLDCTLALIGGNGGREETFTLFFAERAGGTTQLVGSPTFDVVFEAEQPLIDALFAVVYGPKDPGPREPAPAATGSSDAPATAPEGPAPAPAP